MSFYDQARRFSRWWTYLIVITVVLGLVLTFAGDPILNRLAATCGAAPVYRADVPADLRASLDLLFQRGLLYCSRPPKGMRTVTEPIYWGSDGVSSILFFQSDDLGEVELVRYGFGESPGSAFVPGAPGAAPPVGFREERPEEADLANHAPAGASYFYRLQGAPLPTDGVVVVTLDGPAVEQPRGGGRDAFRDLDMLWKWLRRQPAASLESTQVMTPISIVPGRWADVPRRLVNPALADEEGQASLKALRAAAPAAPMPYHTVAGLLHTTVWVAGVVSGTQPALLLQPDGASVGIPTTPPIEPVAQSIWISTSALHPMVLAHFAFAPLTTIGEGRGHYRALYWNDREAAPDGPTDAIWEVTVP